MRAAVTDFIEFLVLDMEATESTAYAEELLSQAKAKITAGAGQLGFLMSASANGKSFTKAQDLTAREVALAARKALDQYNDEAGSGPITFLDFSRIAE